MSLLEYEIPTGPYSRLTLPENARLPINRCNLGSAVLGSLTYQSHPIPLEIDGIHPFHDDLFRALADLPTHAERARRFMDYMRVHFCLANLEEAGLDSERGKRKKRANANYLRMLRGWSFDSNGREGAVLKSWVETRFGLLAQHHVAPLGEGEARNAFMHQATAGIYATNAIEAQLDLLYSYCQYELAIQHPQARHLNLYRGINRLDEHQVLERRSRRRCYVVLNNLNSFTARRERADELGDYILEARVPVPKIFSFNLLLPGMLKGEDEFVVIGGLYEVEITSL